MSFSVINGVAWIELEGTLMVFLGFRRPTKICL
jgi:hypothetical protein